MWGIGRIWSEAVRMLEEYEERAIARCATKIDGRFV
jgi:hypothetical protein